MNTRSSEHAFIGRKYEYDLLSEQGKTPSASLIIVHGRRRVGKTRLVTEFYRDKNLWRFDGIEGGSKPIQISNILDRISLHSGDDLYKRLRCADWIELLKILDKAIANSPEGYNRAVLLDEFQYMAVRKQQLVSALKWAWDNLWHDKAGFTLILCGSVASFMLKKVVKSSSLYGRIDLEINLTPLSIPETSLFFEGKKSVREICDLYMFCGGIPEYLLKINPKESVFQNIARLGFCKNGYFISEFDRIFKDIFREEKIYKRIILALSRYRSLKIPELASLLKVSKGGGFAEHLDNLEAAGFVKSIVPLNRSGDSKLKRYTLDDEYLLFYFKFINPHLRMIRENTDPAYGLALLKGQSFRSWAGFAFERLCLKHVKTLMAHLKIDQLVKTYGAYFDRGSNDKDGVQIDLLFDRHDPVVTLCELKYSDGLIDKGIMKEVERKVALLGETHKTVERVLITTNGITKELADTRYFSKIVTIDELFGND